MLKLARGPEFNDVVTSLTSTRPMIVGSLAGVASATVTALTFLLLVPEAGFSYWEISALPSLLTWAFFMAWLPGLVVGAAGGTIVFRYSASLSSGQGQVVLALAITVAAVVITQLLLPMAWQLPRLKVAAIIGMVTFACACLSIRFVLADVRKGV